MKKLLIILLIGISITSLSKEENTYYDSLFYAGNNTYKSQNYDSAIFIYSQILNSGFESAPLYFNIANAHFKKNNIPEAILFYEKSLKIQPNNPDALYNLELSNKKIVDKIQALPKPFFVEWRNEFIYGLPVDSWAFLTIAFLICCLIFFLIYVQTNRAVWKRISFFLAFVFLLGMTISLVSAYALQHQIIHNQDAIIFSNRTNVYAEPNTSSSVLFVIHKGLKVTILNKESQWLNIYLPDGSKGWIPLEVVQLI